MKKLFTIVALVVTAVSFAQLKVKDVDTTPAELVGEYKPMGVLFLKLEKEKGICTLTYKDLKFREISEYKSFDFLESDLDAIYELLTNFEGVKEGDEKEAEVTEGVKLNIVYKKSMGKMFTYIYHTNKAGVTGEFSMGPKEAAKLFGKKKK